MKSFYLCFVLSMIFSGAAHSQYFRQAPRFAWNPYQYHNYVYRNYRNAVFHHWIQFRPPHGYRNGYVFFQGYHFWGHNGFFYRYSNVDICHYQLVDRFGVIRDYFGRPIRRPVAVQTWWNQFCNVGLNYCLRSMEQMNWQYRSPGRFFCAETYRRPY